MFSRILFSILLISIINEVYHAERLLGCTKFSDRPRGSPAGAQEIAVILNSDSTNDVNFIPVVVSSEFMPAYLVLESCEKGASTMDVINKTILKDKADNYKKQAKEIRIDFGALENNCMLFADIKSKIEKVLFPNAIPTLYIDFIKKNTTTKKAIKRLEKGDFLLLDDCKTNSGDFADLTRVNDLVHRMAKGLQDGIKIGFSDTHSCQSIVNIAKAILDGIKTKYTTVSKVTELAAPDTVPSTITEGTHIRYKNGKFALVADCTKLMSIELGTVAELENVLDNIANPQITRVEEALKST